MQIKATKTRHGDSCLGLKKLVAKARPKRTTAAILRMFLIFIVI